MLSFQDGVRTIMPGSLVLLSEGQWSDYAVRALYRCRKPIQDGIMERYVGEHPAQRGYNWESEAFTAWLVAQGYVERESYVEWHRFRDLRTEEWKMTIEEVQS